MKSSGFLLYKYFEGLFFKVVEGQKAFVGLKIAPNATKTCLFAGILFTSQVAHSYRIFHVEQKVQLLARVSG